MYKNSSRKKKRRVTYIYPELSPIVSPIFIINKKEAREKRIIMDYKELNKHIIQDNDAMVNICTIMESLTGKELFSKFDIR